MERDQALPHGLLFVATVIAIGAAAPKPPGATEVAYYDFRELPDRDFFEPEGWTRLIRVGYPFFVKTELARTHAAVGTRSLAYHLDGGHCGYFSPPLPASNQFDYVLQAQVKTQGLSHDQAFVLLEFLDAELNLIGKQHLSQRLGGTRDWTKLTVGPIAEDSDAVRFLRIACFTQHGQSKDLTGTVYFDDLWVGKLPRAMVTTSGAFRLFDLNESRHVDVRVTGAQDRRMDARFFLYDIDGKPISEKVAELVPDRNGVGTVRWILPIDEVGYYRLDVHLDEGSRQVIRERFPITLMRAYPERPSGSFALSAPAPRHGFENYERLLTYSGTRWLKLPLWAATERNPEFDRSKPNFIYFTERMETKGHGLIGGLDTPSQDVLEYLPRSEAAMAEVFSLPVERWSPALQDVLARFSLKVTQWQVGADSDTSFDTLSNLDGVLGLLRTELRQYGSDTQIGLVWTWPAPPPQSPAISFVSLTDAPPVDSNGPSARTWSPLSHQELLAYLRGLTGSEQDLAAGGADESVPTEEASAPPPAGRARTEAEAARLRIAPPNPKVWVQIAPISSRRYSTEARISDFALRILAAKIGNADRILATRITDPDHGLIHSDGSPNEMFTVWRTLVEHLSGSEFVGRLSLPQQAQTLVFAKNGLASIFCWSEQPTSLEMVLGQDAERVDLWGRRSRLGEGIVHRVELTPQPIVLTNVSEPLVRLQIDTHFVKGRLPSEWGRQIDGLRIVNSFPVAIRGTAKPRFPESWDARPRELRFEIAPGAEYTGDIEFDIKAGELHGDFDVPIEFELFVDREYRFSLERPYRLGQDEISTYAATQLNDDGALVVNVEITNLTDKPISLRAVLLAFDRATQRQLVLSLRPAQTRALRYFYDDGQTLLGREMQIRLSESQGGRRQFNFAIRAER